MRHDQLKFAEVIPTEYTCPYCQKVYSEARKGPCGHVLCTGCWIDGDNDKKVCPLCPIKEEYPAEQIVLETTINRIVGKLSTSCTYEGCFKDIPLHCRERHLETCDCRDDIGKLFIAPDQDIQSRRLSSMWENSSRTIIVLKVITLGALITVFTYLGVPMEKYMFAFQCFLFGGDAAQIGNVGPSSISSRPFDHSKLSTRAVNITTNETLQQYIKN